MAANQSIAVRVKRPHHATLPPDSLRRPHPFICKDGTHCFRIELTQGKFALIDECDAAAASKCLWRAHRDYKSDRFYAVGARGLHLHRLVTNCPRGQEVDHKNGDGLDNRRSNLRPCTHAQNIANKRKQRSGRAPASKFKGVKFCKFWKKWTSRAAHHQRGSVHSMRNTALSAALAYDIGAVRLFGEFAKINFPERLPIILAEIGAALAE